ncbi:MAG TPA: hypothetical protein PK156_45580 [Polyangium sp.]|nr:hypothetical protein [Polyangium sp.]
MSRRRRTNWILCLLALFALAGGLLFASSRSRAGMSPALAMPLTHMPLPDIRLPAVAKSAESLPELHDPVPSAAPAPSSERADAHFDRSWRAPLAGGLLMFPPSFESADGQYDLILHLNGNTDLVEQSYGFAGVNAVIAILNLGVGSGVYEDRFAEPSGLRLMLSRAQSVMKQRGLKNARLRRIGLSSWSSGFGGIFKILGQEEFFERISAVVLIDSIHCGYNLHTKALKPEQIGPMRKLAEKAVRGDVLLTIVHSEIATYGYYNAHDTTDFLLDWVHVRRTPTSVKQPLPDIEAMKNVVPNEYMRPLNPLTEAHRGELHVRGYGGSGPMTHMLHLVQFSTTALPDLVHYWALPKK